MLLTRWHLTVRETNTSLLRLKNISCIEFFRVPKKRNWISTVPGERGGAEVRKLACLGPALTNYTLQSFPKNCRTITTAFEFKSIPLPTSEASQELKMAETSEQQGYDHMRSWTQPPRWNNPF